jgi:hypothetical protein
MKKKRVLYIVIIILLLSYACAKSYDLVSETISGDELQKELKKETENE